MGNKVEVEDQSTGHPVYIFLYFVLIWWLKQVSFMEGQAESKSSELLQYLLKYYGSQIFFLLI